MIPLPIRLQELRNEKQLSLERLSKETGLSRAALSYYETAKRYPGAFAIITLARYFHVTTDYLLGLEN